MTVMEYPSRISWKVAIPMMFFWLIVGIAIWIIPFSTVSDMSWPTWINNLFNSPILQIFIKIIASFAALFGILGTLAWAKYGEDKNE